MLSALIFDVDGTLADTESAPRSVQPCVCRSGARLGVGRGYLQKTAGNIRRQRRILHYWQQVQPDIKAINNSGVQDTVARIHELKTAAYEQAVQDGAVQLRPGVLRLIDAAHKDGLRLAIATTTSPVNIFCALACCHWPGLVALFSGD